MKVDIKKTEEEFDPFAVIYCREITGKILSAAEALGRTGDVITA